MPVCQIFPSGDMEHNNRPLTLRNAATDIAVLSPSRLTMRYGKQTALRSTLLLPVPQCQTASFFPQVPARKAGEPPLQCTSGARCSCQAIPMCHTSSFRGLRLFLASFFYSFMRVAIPFFAATTASNSTHGSAPATVFHSRNIDIAQYPCQHPSFLPLLLAIIIVFA